MTGVSFSGWNDKGDGRSNPAKEHLRRELILKLHLPNASENKVDGDGWIEITDGRVELTYSLSDKTWCDLSDAEMLLPVPDADNVLLVPEENIGDFDFEVTLTISDYQPPQSWHSDAALMTIPKVTGKSKQQLIEMLTPIIQPHFEQITAPESSDPDGEIVVRDLDFKGYYWHTIGEMYYSISFGRERILSSIRKGKIKLFA